MEPVAVVVVVIAAGTLGYFVGQRVERERWVRRARTAFTHRVKEET